LDERPAGIGGKRVGKAIAGTGNAMVKVDRH
jgi:hypothetical protein